MALRFDRGNTAVVILRHLRHGPRRQLVGRGNIGQARFDPRQCQAEGPVA